jgi:Zn-dependent peptidase ImmA (M78 family)
MTLTELGERVAISPAMLSQIERGQREPSPLLESALAETLQVSPTFLSAPGDDDDIFGDECNLRHRPSTPQKLKTKVFATGTLFGMLVEYLARHVPFPAYDIPEVRAQTDREIEEAAAYCRAHWGLGQGPISSMVRVLENAGVVVARLSEDSKKIDAFSRTGRTSVVVLNTFKGSATRSRYDCGHELGHLVLHNGIITGDKETERQADRFASAFLLPAEAFIEDFRSAVGTWNWAGVFELKRSFAVSAPAIVRRAFDLDLIGPSQYRRSYKYMSAKGWLHGKKPEPYEPQPEQPELLHAAVDWLEENRGESPLEVARALGWSPDLFQKISGVDIRKYERLADVASIDKWRKRRRG